MPQRPRPVVFDEGPADDPQAGGGDTTVIARPAPTRGAEPLAIPLGMGADPSIAQAVHLGEIDPKVWLPIVLGAAGASMTGGLSIPAQAGVQAAIAGGTGKAMGGSIEDALTDAAMSGGLGLATGYGAKLAGKIGQTILRMGRAGDAATTAADEAVRGAGKAARTEKLLDAMKDVGVVTDRPVGTGIIDPSTGKEFTRLEPTQFMQESGEKIAQRARAENLGILRGAGELDVNPTPAGGVSPVVPQGGSVLEDYLKKAMYGSAAGTGGALGWYAVRSLWDSLFGHAPAAPKR